MDERKLFDVMQSYQKTQSLEKTAKEMNFSTSTVRKALLTLGLWKNDMTERIRQIRMIHPEWNTREIADELSVSVKTIQLYTPYEIDYETESGRTSAERRKQEQKCAEKEYSAQLESVKQNIGTDEKSFVDRSLRDTAPLKKGRCGDTLWWRLFDNDLLEIIGTGSMWNNFDCSDIRFSIKKILIGDEVRSIGTGAFSYCPFLREIVFGRNVQVIGPRAFYHCDNLNRITVPDDLQDTWGKIDIFKGSPITSVFVPATVKIIPPEVLEIPSIVRFVCELSNEECKEGYFSLDGVLYYRNAGSRILEIVKCPSSKPVYSYQILEGTTKICPNCFNMFDQQQTLEEVEIPDTVETIGYAAFFRNKKLKRVRIPDRVKNIDQAAFYECSELEAVEFGNSLNLIGITAFRLCTKIEKLVIPEKVNVIGDEAFAKCPGIKEAVFLGDAPRLKTHDYYTEGIFGRRAEDFRILYMEGRHGWEDPWMGYRTYAEGMTSFLDLYSVK